MQRHREEMEEALATTTIDRHRRDLDTREGGKDFKEMVVVVSLKTTKGSKGGSNREATITLKEGSTYDLLTQFS